MRPPRSRAHRDRRGSAQRGVLCQELPFRSGFHSPLFADYLAPHRAHLADARAAAPARAAVVGDDVRAVSRRARRDPRARDRSPRQAGAVPRARRARCTRPACARSSQLGVGSVGGFVDDTLRGRDHLAIAAASAKHAGRVAARARRAPRCSPTASLDRARAGDAAPAPTRVARHDARSSACRSSGSAARCRRCRSIARRQRSRRRRPGARRARRDARRGRRGEPRGRRRVSRAARATDATLHDAGARCRSTPCPRCIDHCFYRQPPGWPTVVRSLPGRADDDDDRHDDRRRARARARTASRSPSRTSARMRWLAVAPPSTSRSRCTAKRATTPSVVDVEHPRLRARDRAASPTLSRRAARRAARRSTNAARGAASPPRRCTPIAGCSTARSIRASSRSARSATTASTARSTSLPAPGALLDCAGQLMGWWVMQHRDARSARDAGARSSASRCSAPSRAPGERVACRVRMRDVGEREVRADLELVARRPRVGADRRLGRSPLRQRRRRVGRAACIPSTTCSRAARRAATSRVTEHWRGAASRELMMRRYLGERERAEHDAHRRRAAGAAGCSAGSRSRTPCGMHRWRDRRARAICPVEIAVANDAERPRRTSIAGAARLGRAQGRPRGRDRRRRARCRHRLERIEPRTDAFVGDRVHAGRARARRRPRPRRVADARLWAAKEASRRRAAPA